MKTLEIKNLVKKFGKITAVNDISFYVQPGECFGLLGPNGAGKSTTIEIIELIQEPTAGEVLFQGEPRGRNYLSQIGVQFQETALLPHLSVRECLETFSQLYPKTRPLETLIDICQLAEFSNQRHEDISGGQKQRLLLAMALVHDPDLILLDEPTTGLDPAARRNLWQIVRDIKSEGKTLILTTHYMDEAQQLCDRIGIMDRGKILVEGSPKSLLETNCQEIVIELPRGIADATLEKVKIEFDQVLIRDHNFEIITLDLNQSLAKLSSLNLDIKGLSIRPSNLEDLFLKLTGEEIRQ